jgi:DNA sulfur modification protein DndB
VPRTLRGNVSASKLPAATVMANGSESNQEELIVPALRAIIGTWAYYAASLRFADVASRIKFASEVHGRDRQLNELIQRSLEKSASDIATYLRRQKEERFLNALVVGVYEGDPKWFNATINETERLDASRIPAYGLHALGLLVFDGRERLFALDGQHRVEGIRQALHGDSSLNDEQILVLFVGHQNTAAGLRRTRRLFTTLNRYAKPVSKSDLIALDEDDAVAIVTRTLVMTHALFHNRTST